MWPSDSSKSQAFALFATHYFELTELAAQYHGIVNVHLDAVEHGDKLVFMHALKEGPANRSFGLQVAALAGLPKAVIADAKRYLDALEAGTSKPAMARHGKETASPQLGLFALPQAPPLPSAVELALRALDGDELTPRAALDAIYQLKSLLPNT